MPNENSLPVRSETNPRKLAGAIAARAQNGDVLLTAIGQASTHRLVLALGTLAEWGYDPLCKFSLAPTDVGMQISCTVQKCGPLTITTE